MSFVVTVNDGIAFWSQDAAAAILLAEARKRQTPGARVVVGYGEARNVQGCAEAAGQIYPVMVVN